MVVVGGLNNLNSIQSIGVDNIGRKPKSVEVMIKQRTTHLSKQEIEERQEAEHRIRSGENNIKCPSWLDKNARKKWNILLKKSTETKMFGEQDIDMLALFCDAYSDYLECTRIIKDDGLVKKHTNKAGETNEVAHPLLAKKNQLYNQMKSLAVELGLTPSARLRFTLPKQEEERDLFGEMFD